MHAFLGAQIGDIFKKNQLVLTTVPRDTPVIVEQGENDDHIYEWTVQMPIIMTYATNNNLTRQEKSIITLTIVRLQKVQRALQLKNGRWVTDLGC